MLICRIDGNWTARSMATCRPVLGVFLPEALRGLQLLTVDKASVVRWWSMEGAGKMSIRLRLTP